MRDRGIGKPSVVTKSKKPETIASTGGCKGQGKSAGGWDGTNTFITPNKRLSFHP